MKMPQAENLEVSKPRISDWYSHSSEFKPGHTIKKTEHPIVEPIVEKFRDTAFVLQVGKLDEVLSDVMVIFGNSQSSYDLPRTIIDKVGPQIQREFQNKYPKGLRKEKVAVLSGFNLPVWKIFYCEFSLDEERFTVSLGVKVKELCKRVQFSSISTIYFYVDQDTLEWIKLKKIAEDEIFTKRVDSPLVSPVSTDVTMLSTNPERKVFNVGHLSVIIQVGKLEEIQSDILVIFKVAKGQWHTQNLPSEILEKAGPMIQREFKEKFPAGLDFAVVAVLNGYNLPFRKILYGVFPRWPVPWLKQVVSMFLTKCFQLSSDEEIKSMAFMIPSVTYQVAEMYASVLHSCVELRMFEKPYLSISMHNIVIKNGCTGANMLRKVFEEEWDRRIVFNEGHVIVMIRERLLEDILMRRGKETQICAILSEEPQEKAIISDSKALVIISDSENDISIILEEIRPSLKVKFQTKYKSGEVVILDGLNNPFKKIYCSICRSEYEITDFIVKCFQMAENDKMNSIILPSESEWSFRATKIAQELNMCLRIFVIENPFSSIRRLYSDSHIFRQDISDVTSVKVFKGRQVTVVLNATYDEIEYVLGFRGKDGGELAYKVNSVHVICGVADVGQPRGKIHEYIYLTQSQQTRKSFTSGGVFVLQLELSDTVRAFFGTPNLDRQDMDIFFCKCLQIADESGVSSVTFLVPNIVRSIKLFASTLCSCVKRFAKNNPSSSIKRIYIRIYKRNPKFQETKQVFEEEWAKASGEQGLLL